MELRCCPRKLEATGGRTEQESLGWVWEGPTGSLAERGTRRSGEPAPEGALGLVPGDRTQAPVSGQHSGTVTTFCIGQFVDKG